MFKFAKPRGFINFRNNLYVKPDVIRMNVGVPCKILFIADVHLRRSHPEEIPLLIDACRSLEPDIILLGGDIAEFKEGLGIVCAAIRKMFPSACMFAVPGNNDDGDRNQQGKILAESACKYLLNETVRCGNIEIVGVEDSDKHTPCCKGLFTDEPGVYRILLSHAPHAFLLEEASSKPDLMLSGHTHGGQINVLGLTCYLLGYESSYRFTHLAGVKKKGKTVCIVSRGIGVSKYPLRVGARPEIYYLTGSEKV